MSARYKAARLNPAMGSALRVESLDQSLTKLDNKKILAILKMILSIY